MECMGRIILDILLTGVDSGVGGPTHTGTRVKSPFVGGVRLSHRIADAPALQAFGPTDRHPVDLNDDDALNDLIRNRADTVYHPVGTCRMGADADSVVDPTLKVRGIDGLWIADASIMPKIVSGNTNAPSIMIGERCADFVKAAE